MKKAILICLSDKQKQPCSVEKICISTESVMEYFAKHQPDSTLVFGHRFTVNSQFVMPSDYYDSLEEWIDSHLAEKAELSHIFLQAVYTFTYGEQYITDYILRVINI